MEELVLNSIEPSDWSKGDEQVELVFKVSETLSESCEHLSGSLRVTHIRHFVMPCVAPHVIDLGWRIVLAELPEAEVEVLLFIIGVIGVECLVPSAILAHPIVTQPHIVSKSRKFKSCSIVTI